MIAAMLPEDLPPMAPFPDLPSTGKRSGDAGSPLLSESQRQEFARAAGSLEGKTPPVPVNEPVQEADDDFILTSPPKKPEPFLNAAPAGAEPFASLLPEEPALSVDFLALTSSSPVKELPGDALDLHGFAGSLSGTLAAGFPSAAPPTPSPDWDFSSLLPVPETQAPEKPSDSPKTAAPTSPSPTEPVVPAILPIQKPAATPSSTVTAPSAVESSGPAFSAAAKAAIASEAPAPAAFEPPPKATDAAHDFDAALAFLASPAVAVAAAPQAEILDPNDRGIGMVLSGAILIVAGMLLACRVPSLALEADALAVSSRAAADVRVWHLQGEMFLCAAGAAASLLLGIGSATLRRWAPPLIHAASWVILLTVLVCMAVATASMFYFSANETPGDAVPADGVAWFALAGILGIALPLGLIALFQRPSVAGLCVLIDKKPRWTDRRTIPALMVFVSAALLATGAFALSIAHAAIPLFGEFRDGNAGVQAWAATGLLAAVAAWLASANKPAGWWLLLTLSLVIAVSLFLTCRIFDWRHLFELPTAADSNSSVRGLMTAAAMFPPIFILLMTRRSFLHHG